MYENTQLHRKCVENQNQTKKENKNKRHSALNPLRSNKIHAYHFTRINTLETNASRIGAYSEGVCVFSAG